MKTFENKLLYLLLLRNNNILLNFKFSYHNFCGNISLYSEPYMRKKILKKSTMSQQNLKTNFPNFSFVLQINQNHVLFQRRDYQYRVGTPLCLLCTFDPINATYTACKRNKRRELYYQMSLPIVLIAQNFPNIVVKCVNFLCVSLRVLGITKNKQVRVEMY